METFDRKIVDGMLSCDAKVIRSFWIEQCIPMFRYIIQKIFDRKAEVESLIGELNLYLQADDWRKLRLFDYRSRLVTWLLVVATRFFQEKQTKMIEKEPAANCRDETNQQLDVENLINKLPNERYRFVLSKLILEGDEPQEVADEMGITVDSLYNVKRWAIQAFIRVAGKEDCYEK
jgi:hypothetical protein